ncbi:hypothetical protein BAE44_0020744 [Dichanthelium oligosanthes]|uniref:Uncharacterized protein n=1 Tax=Dichanthelium oligosanthes TaxID=888268 RepID=A0A1E5UZP3_9POAL|nr:hypothetical protein BAE44_0020744 [Dichanthelium oligosanthes]
MFFYPSPEWLIAPIIDTIMLRPSSGATGLKKDLVRKKSCVGLWLGFSEKKIKLLKKTFLYYVLPGCF